MDNSSSRRNSDLKSNNIGYSGTCMGCQAAEVFAEDDANLVEEPTWQHADEMISAEGEYPSCLVEAIFPQQMSERCEAQRAQNGLTGISSVYESIGREAVSSHATNQQRPGRVNTDGLGGPHQEKKTRGVERAAALHVGRGRDVYPHTARRSRGKGLGVRRYSVQAPLASFAAYDKLLPRADRTGQKHRGWVTCKEGGQPRLITDLRAFVKCFPELEKCATLPPTGWGKYTPPGGTKPRWAEGTMEGHTRLSSEQRARFGYDRGAVDTKRERDAWRWPTPRDAAALESATSAGRLVTLGRQMLKGGDDRPPVTGKWCRDHSLDLMANSRLLSARSGRTGVDVSRSAHSPACA